MYDPVGIKFYTLAVTVGSLSCYFRTCGNLLKFELQNNGRDNQTSDQQTICFTRPIHFSLRDPICIEIFVVSNDVCCQLKNMLCYAIQFLVLTCFVDILCCLIKICRFLGSWKLPFFILPEFFLPRQSISFSQVILIG